MTGSQSLPQHNFRLQNDTSTLERGSQKYAPVIDLKATVNLNGVYTAILCKAPFRIRPA